MKDIFVNVVSCPLSKPTDWALRRWHPDDVRSIEPSKSPSTQAIVITPYGQFFTDEEPGEVVRKVEEALVARAALVQGRAP